MPHDKFGNELKQGDVALVSTQRIKDGIYSNDGLMEIVVKEIREGQYECNSSIVFEVTVGNLTTKALIKKP